MVAIFNSVKTKTKKQRNNNIRYMKLVTGL